MPLVDYCRIKCKVVTKKKREGREGTKKGKKEEKKT